MYRKQFAVNDRVVIIRGISRSNPFRVVPRGAIGTVKSYHVLSDCYKVIFDAGILETDKYTEQYVPGWFMEYLSD
jgi:hypothetical protein